MLFGIAEFGGQATEGGKYAGEFRHHYPGNTEFPGQRHRMHGAGAAKGDQGTGARIDAAFHRNPAQRARHGSIGDPVDAEGGFIYRGGKCIGKCLHGDPGRFPAQVDRATEQASGIEIAQGHIGIGHRGQFATQSVTGRAGLGTGTIGTDTHGRSFHARNGTTTGADGFNRNHELAHRAAGEMLVATHLNLAFNNHAGIGGGAPHIETNGIVETELAAYLARRGHPCCGAGQGKRQGASSNRLDRSHATGRMEQMDVTVVSRPGLKLIQVARRQRHQGGA